MADNICLNCRPYSGRPMSNYRVILREIYNRLYRAFGPQHWWPGQTPFEIIIGAILTQNTNWQNVEKAIKNLRQNKYLTPPAMKKIPLKTLSPLIRPAGYYNIKGQRLKEFISFLYAEYNGSITALARENTKTLRNKLLAVKGIGPETADSILLYALKKPVFVVDAYTRRILGRHNLLNHQAGYHVIQDFFTGNLTRSIRLFNEYHALLVKLGKEYCQPTALCSGCPLEGIDKGTKGSLSGCL